LLVEHFQAQKQFFNKDVNEGKIIRMPNNFIPLIKGDEHTKGTQLTRKYDGHNTICLQGFI